MAYAKRYAGGFADNAGGATPIDSVFLNAVETALLELLSADGSVDGQVLQWIQASSKFGPALLLNKNVDAAAAIAKSKLDFTGGNGIVNADIAGSAAIAKSKLASLGIVDADVAAGAAIAMSKINGLGLYRKTTSKAVNTTTGATDLLNGEITIAAGLPGATGVIRLTAWGDWLQNTGGAAAGPRLQLLLGGTTLFDTGAGTSVASSVARSGWKLVAEIINLGLVNSQSAVFSYDVGSAGGFTTGATTLTTGTGFYSTVYDGAVSVLAKALGVTTAAVNTALASALVLNVINGSALVTYETKLTGALIEVL